MIPSKECDISLVIKLRPEIYRYRYARPEDRVHTLARAGAHTHTTTLVTKHPRHQCPYARAGAQELKQVYARTDTAASRLRRCGCKTDGLAGCLAVRLTARLQACLSW